MYDSKKNRYHRTRFTRFKHVLRLSYLCALIAAPSTQIFVQQLQFWQVQVQSLDQSLSRNLQLRIQYLANVWCGCGALILLGDASRLALYIFQQKVKRIPEAGNGFGLSLLTWDLKPITTIGLFASFRNSISRGCFFLQLGENQPFITAWWDGTSCVIFKCDERCKNPWCDGLVETTPLLFFKGNPVIPMVTRTMALCSIGVNSQLAHHSQESQVV